MALQCYMRSKVCYFLFLRPTVGERWSWITLLSHIFLCDNVALLLLLKKQVLLASPFSSHQVAIHRHYIIATMMSPLFAACLIYSWTSRTCHLYRAKCSGHGLDRTKVRLVGMHCASACKCTLTPLLCPVKYNKCQYVCRWYSSRRLARGVATARPDAMFYVQK